VAGNHPRAEISGGKGNLLVISIDSSTGIHVERLSSAGRPPDCSIVDAFIHSEWFASTNKHGRRIEVPPHLVSRLVVKGK
jgi:hypothetical protein